MTGENFGFTAEQYATLNAIIVKDKIVEIRKIYNHRNNPDVILYIEMVNNTFVIFPDGSLKLWWVFNR